ncbi:MAG: 4-alpha-glucanotransferase [Clostridia bacterium]|nr:4-alpha-glucanotransferase [Clostridia bacterium]
MFNRSCGVLCHISSLPGPYGIGTFGKEAVKFAEMLRSMDIRSWQVLPLCPTDDYNSPYAGCSAFAGNPYFIDPEILFEEKLLTKEELESARASQPYSADFEFLKETRLPLFKKAFDRFKEENMPILEKFLKEHPALDDYALFTALKEHYDLLPWWEWPDGLKMREKAALKKAKEELRDEYFFALFLQYQFNKQFTSLKEKVNSLGVSIIGDMPIYLAHDSADVWANRSIFSVDEKTCALRSVAGVPPDYFCAEGQLWGNPLYDWEEMKKDGYKWWIDRAGYSFSLYDAVRIDHFRAFSAYWAVPAGEKATKGEWIKGPGMDFFNALSEKYPQSPIIAEDLGDIDDDVRQLVKDTNFPGMGVMQFAFLSDGDNTHMPYNYSPSTVAYTGTHDNNTILGWLWESDDASRRRICEYCGFEGDWGMGGPDAPCIKTIIKTLFESSALLAIVPVQDLVGFGADTRMNTPGEADGNWAFRITWDSLERINKDFFRKISNMYHRNNNLV